VPALFPKWMNALPTLGAVIGLGGVVSVVAGVTYYFTPKYWEVGYMPDQSTLESPQTGFNHQIHAGKLGLDCRYCHTHVEESRHSNIPAVATCYGCHSEGKLNTEIVPDTKINFIRKAYAEDKSIPWTEIHILPDYVNFPHHVHVNAGVSCFSCHGQIAGMPVVHQAQSLAMKWCLDCHRDPEPNLVPTDQVTNLPWVESEWFVKDVADRAHEGVTPESLMGQLFRAPPQNCAACHY
jgi:hypothetical protein